MLPLNGCCKRYSLAAGPHPRRELTPMPRFGFAWPQLGMAAGAPSTIAAWLVTPSSTAFVLSPKAPSPASPTRPSSLRTARPPDSRCTPSPAPSLSCGERSTAASTRSSISCRALKKKTWTRSATDAARARRQPPEPAARRSSDLLDPEGDGTRVVLDFYRRRDFADSAGRHHRSRHRGPG